MGQANIVRLNNGKWAALFSGGYNNTFDNDADGSANNANHYSDDGNGYIYIVDLETGRLIRKFDKQKGKKEGGSYKHIRAHEKKGKIVCRLLL